MLDEDPDRSRRLRATTLEEVEEIERSLQLVYTLLRAATGGFGLALDISHAHLAPRAPSAEAATLVKGTRMPAEAADAAVQVDFSATMALAPTFVAPLESRLLTGVCGADIVSCTGDYYILAPTGDMLGAGVFVPRTARDADPSSSISPQAVKSSMLQPRTDSARARHEQAVGELPLRFADQQQWRRPLPACADSLPDGQLPQWSHYAPLGHMLVRKDVLEMLATTGWASPSGLPRASAAATPTIQQYCAALNSESAKLVPAHLRFALPFALLPLAYTDVNVGPLLNPTQPGLLVQGGGGASMDSRRTLGEAPPQSWGSGDGPGIPHIAAPPLPTVFRLQHLWGRMPQSSAAAAAAGSAAEGDIGKHSNLAVGSTSSWGEWTELAPALAHPVDWEVAGVLEDASPPVVLFRPVPPPTYHAMGLVAVPTTADTLKGTLTRQTSQPQALGATASGAQAAKLAMARRSARLVPVDETKDGEQEGAGSPVSWSQSNRLMGGEDRDMARRSTFSRAGVHLPQPPSLDSVWCVHVSMVEFDFAVKPTGIPITLKPEASQLGGAAAQKEPTKPGPDTPQLLSMSCVGLTFEARPAASAVVPGRGAPLPAAGSDTLLRLQHQPTARPIGQVAAAPLQRTLREVMGETYRTLSTRHAWLTSGGRPITRSLHIMQSVLADFAARFDWVDLWGQLVGSGQSGFKFVPPLVQESIFMYDALIKAVLGNPILSRNPSLLNQQLRPHAELFNFAQSVAASQPLQPSTLHTCLSIMTNFTQRREWSESGYAAARAVVTQAVARFPGHLQLQSLGVWLLAVLWDMQGRQHVKAFVVRHGEEGAAIPPDMLAKRQAEPHLLQSSRFLAWALCNEYHARCPQAKSSSNSASRDLHCTELEAWYRQSDLASTGCSCTIQ